VAVEGDQSRSRCRNCRRVLPAQRIGRPRQLYVGATQRDYVPVGKR